MRESKSDLWSHAEARMNGKRYNLWQLRWLRLRFNVRYDCKTISHIPSSIAEIEQAAIHTKMRKYRTLVYYVETYAHRPLHKRDRNRRTLHGVRWVKRYHLLVINPFHPKLASTWIGWWKCWCHIMKFRKWRVWHQCHWTQWFWSLLLSIYKDPHVN